MKRILFLFAILCGLSLGSKAQVFRFDFADPFTQQRQQQPEEKVTRPKYKHGAQGVNDFVKKEFHPVQGKASLSGRIVVACLINEKGKVVQTEVLQGIDRELNDEAVRVCGKLKFKPAKRGKKKVKSRYDVVFPIRHGKVSFVTAPTIEI